MGIAISLRTFLEANHLQYDSIVYKCAQSSHPPRIIPGRPLTATDTLRRSRRCTPPLGLCPHELGPATPTEYRRERNGRRDR